MEIVDRILFDYCKELLRLHGDWNYEDRKIKVYDLCEAGIFVDIFIPKWHHLSKERVNVVRHCNWEEWVEGPLKIKVLNHLKGSIYYIRNVMAAKKIKEDVAREKRRVKSMSHTERIRMYANNQWK